MTNETPPTAPPAKAKARSTQLPMQLARPSIEITKELHEVVDAATISLPRDADIYQRDGDLVRVVRSEQVDPAKGVVSGTPQIRAVTLPTMREILCRVACFVRYDGRSRELRQVLPPDNIATAVLARGEWPGVRALSIVTETPCLRPDGSILDRRGYDPSTAILYMPSDDFPRVAIEPTQRDAMNALVRLCELFKHFPFDSEAGRYVAIAAILTMLARPAIAGAVPAMLFDASTRGSGKSLLTDAIALVSTGRSAPRLTYPPDEVELEKVLASAALYGSRLVAIDNVTGTFGCGPLDKVLTADDRVALRVLGKSELRELQWRALIVASGNNIALGADTARRCLVARLEPMTERPEERTGLPDLVADIKARRTELVRDALTILKAWVLAGRPGASASTWGSFTAWAQLIPPAIVFAGGADVLGARAVSAGVEEPEVDALRALLVGLPMLSGGEAMTAKAMVSALYTQDRLRGRDVQPDGHDDLRSAIEWFTSPKPGTAPDPKRLGSALRRFKGRIVAGKRLLTAPARAGVVAWRVESVGGLGGFGGSVPRPPRSENELGERL